MASTQAFKLKALPLACLALLLSGENFTSAFPQNVATDWNFLAQRVVVQQGISNQIAAKYYAFVGLAIYHTLKVVQDKKPAGVDATAAATYSAHYVLSELFPNLQSPIFDGFAKAKLAELKLSKSVLAKSKYVGRQYCVWLLDSRANDGSQELSDFVPSPPGGPVGKYQFTPGQTYVTFPQLAHTRPFLVKNVPSFDKYGGPYPVGSAAYNAEVKTVQSIGEDNSTTRTADETLIALFWADPGNTSALAGHLYNVSNAVVLQNISALETAKVFAALGVAEYDGSIVAWYLKYKHLFWRPTTAIRQGDGINARNPTWSPLLGVPPEPEYPSGHSAMSAAGAGVLAAYRNFSSIDHKTNEIWTVQSPGGLYPARHYSDLGVLAREVGASRIYGGLHFQKSVLDGTQVGQQIGYYVWANIDKLVSKYWPGG